MTFALDATDDLTYRDDPYFISHLLCLRQYIINEDNMQWIDSEVTGPTMWLGKAYWAVNISLLNKEGERLQETWGVPQFEKI